MRHAFLWAIVFLYTLTSLSAQNALIKGTVIDASTEDPLYGVNVLVDGQARASSDFDGSYQLELEPGSYSISFTYIGYGDYKKTIQLASSDTIVVNVHLSDAETHLDVVVVSTSKYGKKIQEETISMNVLAPKAIENSAVNNVKDAVEKVPGLTIIDGQASIRGGSGYAYGVGSRTMMVIDGQPLLTADRSNVDWDFVPVENIETIEVLKGASSVQYGSGALNGTIHVHTGYPTKEPQTKIVSYANIYGAPKDPLYKWWTNDSSYFSKPFGLGTYFVHKQKIKSFDLVIGGMAHASQSHLREEYERRYRMSFKLRYRPPNRPRLNYGINGNVFHRDNSFFFFWNDYNEKEIYIGRPGTSLNLENLFFYVDPYLNYYDKKENKHSIKSRYYYTLDMYASSKPAMHLASVDYNFLKNWDKNITLMVGATNAYFQLINHNNTGLGNHNGNFGGQYIQVDYKWKNLSLAGGGRQEYYRLNSDFIISHPIFRLGANYQLKENNYFRASWGQAYRIPSPAELFVNEKLADAIKIYPNPDLNPESGYTFELGYRRTFNLKEWRSSFDIAGFWTEFEDMIEFRLGIWGDPATEIANGFGFKAINVSNARIAGWELQVITDGKLGSIPLSVLMGYTYNYPVDLNIDSTQRNVGTFIKNAFSAFSNTDEELFEAMLKYRFRHMVKASLDGEWKNLHFGTTFKYYSFIDNIDNILIAIAQGLYEYRVDHPSGDVVVDGRIGYDIADLVNVSLVVNNVFNRDYAIRPAKPDPPRNYTIQLKWTF